MGKGDPPVDQWAKPEFRKRLAETAILFSWILPIYNKETRNVFKLTFQEDIGVMIPQFFRDLFLHCQKHPETTRSFLYFIKQSCEYALGESDKKPEVAELDPAHVNELLRQWTNGLPKK